MQQLESYLLNLCRGLEPVRCAIVHPVKASSLMAAREACEKGLIVPVLVGPQARITEAAQQAQIDIDAFERINTEHSHEAADYAVSMAAKGEVAALMKGALHSDEILSAVVASKSGLRTQRRISHVYVMRLASYPKPILITDAAINIAPDLLTKADITQNAINLWHVVFGQKALPKVAVLAAVETVNPHMQATLDAAALCKMAERGQIVEAILDGPLAFDNAINLKAAQEKNIRSSVAGDADILIVPEIEAGNMLAKQLTFLSGAEAAGVVVGARVPIILTSRADSQATRLMSCALAVLMAKARAEGRLK